MTTRLAHTALVLATLALASGCVVESGGGGRWDRDEGERITCESDDGHRRTCQARGQIQSVELDRQLSRSRCDYGDTWGYRDDRIWVDDGCRARFRVYTRSGGGGRGGWAPSGAIVRCESVDDRYQRCHTGKRVRNAEVERQLSDARCEYGRSWGVEDKAIWVDKGCRADFRVYR